MLMKQALNRSGGTVSYGMRPQALNVLMGVSVTIVHMKFLKDSLQPSLDVIFSARSKPILMFPKLLFLEIIFYQIMIVIFKTAMKIGL